MRVLHVFSTPSPDVPTITAGTTLPEGRGPCVWQLQVWLRRCPAVAPSEIPGVPGLYWLSCHLWACDVCLLLRLCLFPPQPTLRRLTRPQETHGANWAATYSQNEYRSFSHPTRELPLSLVEPIGQQVSSHTLKKTGCRYRRVEIVAQYITSKPSELPETPVFCCCLWG